MAWDFMMETERQPWGWGPWTLLLKYSDLIKTLREGTVLTDVQQVNWALKAINDKNEEGLMSMMKKESKMLKKWIQYAVKKYIKAENSIITQEKKIKDLISNIKKIRYIIKGYYSIIEHSRVDKNNNNLKLM